METQVIEQKDPVQVEETTKTPVGCWAVIAHKETGEVKTLFQKQKTALAKELSSHGQIWAILGVFRGKQLNVEQKVSFSFN